MGRLFRRVINEAQGNLLVCLNTLTDGQAIPTQSLAAGNCVLSLSQYPHRWAGYSDDYADYRDQRLKEVSIPSPMGRLFRLKTALSAPACKKSQYPHRWAGYSDEGNRDI